MHNFDKYAQEANKFINLLADDLGFPQEKGRTGVVLRSILHTLRDRITVGESLNFIAQMPMFIKAIYVDGWKYREHPVRIKTMEEFVHLANEKQGIYAGSETSYLHIIDTEDVRTVIAALRMYISDGEFENLLSQLPEELKMFFSYSG